MRKKKLFVTPRVIQEVQVQLEKDLLGASVQNVTKITSMGIGADYFEFSEPTDGSTNPYSVDWVD